jgi:gliding motility-associated-like protein
MNYSKVTQKCTIFGLMKTMLFMLLFTLNANAQWQNGLWTGKQAYNWCLEANFGLDFNYGLYTFSGIGMNVLEGNTSISDANGNLLFYSGGGAIWNRNHQLALNGDNILGSESSTQHGVFIQKPGDPNIYYLFTVGAYNSGFGLVYSEIDLTLDGGFGGVTENKNIVVNPDIAGEKITAVFHADKEQVWVITHKVTGNEFAAFLVSSTGISSTPVLSAAGFTYSDTGSNTATHGPCAQLKASPDGTKIASTIMRGVSKGIDLCNFNNETGAIELITHLSGFNGDLYGLEFSPNSKLLYASDPIGWGFGGAVRQFDVSAGTPEAIAASVYTAVNLGNFNFSDINLAMQLAPDGRIYIRNNSGHVLNVINYPNNSGAACGFALDYINTTSVIVYGLPTFNQSYFQSGIIAEKLCNGNRLFQLVRVPDASSITWNFGDPASGENNVSENGFHIYNVEGTYTITATVVSNGATQIITTELVVPDPNGGIIAPNDLVQCESAPGEATFDLTTIEAQILANVNADDYSVYYYTTEYDAISNGNSLTQPESFVSGGQTIYIQVQSLVTGCLLTKQFELIVNPTPLANTIPDLSECTNNGIIPAFDLTQQETQLLGSQTGMTVAYYISLSDTTNGTNPISTPYNFTPPTNEQTVYVVVSNTNGCRVYTQFEVVLQQPVVTPLQDLTVCNNTQSSTFDLTIQETVLLNGQNNVTIHYFTSLSNAEQGIDPIANPHSFENTQSQQTIYIALTGINGCKNYTNFDITVNEKPNAPALPGLTLCGYDGKAEFDLTSHESILTEGQENIVITYHTSQEDAQNGNNVINNMESFENTANPQVIYVRLSSAACFAITSFILTVNEKPVIEDGQEFTACSTVDLTALQPVTNNTTLQYFANEEDAMAQTNAIANPDMFTLTGDITLYVNAQHESGCSTVASIKLKKVFCEIPKGISPNGDNINDNFELTYMDVAKISIFNRYGKTVYSFSNYTNQWHGQEDNGNELPTGTYYYTISLKNGTEKSGWVYINRQAN